MDRKIHSSKRLTFSKTRKTAGVLCLGLGLGTAIAHGSRAAHSTVTATLPSATSPSLGHVIVALYGTPTAGAASLSNLLPSGISRFTHPDVLEQMEPIFAKLKQAGTEAGLDMDSFSSWNPTFRDSLWVQIATEEIEAIRNKTFSVEARTGETDAAAAFDIASDLYTLSIANSIFFSENELVRIRKPYLAAREKLPPAEATQLNAAVRQKIRKLRSAWGDRNWQSTEVPAGPLALGSSPMTLLPHKPARELAISGEVPALVDKLWELALRQRASDIHLEPLLENGPENNGLYVRFRVDGAMTQVHKFPEALIASITSRIKILANMDITMKQLPQDGQITLRRQRRLIDLRASTLPTLHGEKVVIRILDQSNSTMGLSDLGMDPKTQNRFEPLIQKLNGLFLVTGPTGSGKTTTLYSILNHINSDGINIMTLED
ncbi:MAG: Flp pilus assembly complex ATPase component TadA, partial [Elusimicrobia bacterium]|nr:Flp pilus assembly complex ATPase component TadA [Elusimicrobiota bacterium]